MHKVLVVAAVALTLAGCETCAAGSRRWRRINRWRFRSFDRRSGHPVSRWGCCRRPDWGRGWGHYRRRYASRTLLLSHGIWPSSLCALPVI